MTEKKLRLIIFLILLTIGLINKISSYVSESMPINYATLIGIFAGLVIGIFWWFIIAFLIAKIFYWIKNSFSKKKSSLHK